ncbi:InlB B-repeat-containing protein [Candidatus Saccharibacteria bacterium]|nr:InlB B-repeat-containing protein [Candidatus Saccharibacteria bacterium]
MIKKGDTLIEVTLAVGIFSMVAIAIVAVMVGGTSNAQATLETTLAREEIDAQAEALRFIHAAYLADEESGEGKDPYTKLWKSIVSKAYKPNGSAKDAMFQQYTPTSCKDVYSNTEVLNHAFVINPRTLNGLTLTNQDKTLIPYSSSKFVQTSTYPRILYNSEDSSASVLKKAEGLYVIPIVDPKSTTIIGASSNKASAYFDFYIRSCWYGNGSETPSTISTVIRLFDPEGLPKDPADTHGSTIPTNTLDPTAPTEPVTPVTNALTVTFNANNGTDDQTYQTMEVGEQTTLDPNPFSKSGQVFVGWNTSSTATTAKYKDGADVIFVSDTQLFAVWAPAITISFRPNGGNGSMANQIAGKGISTQLNANSFTRSGYTFIGWSTSSSASSATYNDRAVVRFTNSTTLYAVWKRTVTVTFIDVDDNGRELGSYLQTVPLYEYANLKLNEFSRPGYSFEGWRTSRYTSNVRYENGERVYFSNNMTLYSTWKRYIQDFTLAQCQAEASSRYVELADKRDGKKYDVRYINGRCWMTSDLLYGSTIYGGHYYGYYYHGYYNPDDPGTDSACPAGWGIPNENDANSLENHVSAFNPSNRGFLVYYGGILPSEDGTFPYYMVTMNDGIRDAFYVTNRYYGGIHFANFSDFPYYSRFTDYAFPIRCIRNN